MPKQYRTCPQARNTKVLPWKQCKELPPSAPVGEYKIEIFQPGAPTAEAKIKLAEESFAIRQQGFVALVSRGAKDYAFLYGLICVLVAVAAGWITERVFRNRR